MKIEISNEEIKALRIALAKSTLSEDLSERNECNTPIGKAYYSVSYRIRTLCDEVWKNEAVQYTPKN
tara:strand:+ start:931 stop:1131 length:201 start_codon:yes stop_codon:yes gene_type:complete